MSLTRNLTRLTAVSFPSIDHTGKDRHVVCAAGRYHMPMPSRPGDEPVLCDKQPGLIMEDVYSGEPGQSSLRYEGQSAYFRPGTDIYLTGHAKTLHQKKKKYMLIRLSVGLIQKQAIVFGNRFWRPKLFGLKPSEPLPFTSMPVIHEKCFGGVTPKKREQKPSFIPENPVGCGFYSTPSLAEHKLLPNIEDIKDLIKTIKDRPTPSGFGPIARHWMPRVDYAGTYDDAWLQYKAPFWPDDFDPRFFNAASPGLTCHPFLQGGEPVSLRGFSREGQYQFLLPKIRLLAKFEFPHSVEKKMLVLDAIHFEPDVEAMTLFYRTSITTHHRITDHLSTTIRQLEEWENIPV